MGKDERVSVKKTVFKMKNPMPQSRLTVFVYIVRLKIVRRIGITLAGIFTLYFGGNKKVWRDIVSFGEVVAVGQVASLFLICVITFPKENVKCELDDILGIGVLLLVR